MASLKDTLKSMVSFGWSMSLFGLQQLVHLTSPGERGTDDATAAFDAVARAARGEPAAPGPRPDAAPATDDPGAAAAAGRPLRRVDSGRLDCSTFVVLGDSLAAGMGDFAVSAAAQRACFPAQLAAQMGAALSQPLFEEPGLGGFAGFEPLPVEVPGVMQTSLLERFPPTGGFGNLAVPGFTLADALGRRPAAPLVRRRDRRQTAANLILGLPVFLAGGKSPGPTQLEAALARRPTFALVALGYDELLAAAFGGAGQLAGPGDFGAEARRLLAALRRTGCEVLVVNLPDPGETAGLARLDAAARALSVEPGALAATYGLAAEDRVTATGLFEIGAQILAGTAAPLGDRAVVRAPAAAALAAAARARNDALAAAAAEHGALLFDLAALLRRLREEGLAAGDRRLTADYLGGFYNLNGCFPGAAGNALIANGILAQLDHAYGASFPSIDVASVAAADPVAAYRAAGPASAPAPLPRTAPAARVAIAPSAPRPAHRAGGGALAPEPPSGPLRLPASLEQTLPLARAASYHGDALRVVNCRDPQESRFGSTGGVLFGGLAMFDSHLTGSIRIRFTPPVGGITRFTVTHEGGLDGEDGLLATPQLFRWPVRQARVEDDPQAVSSGTLDLATGEVGDLQYYAHYVNSALFGLAQVNPGFPRQPIAFPGQYGSASARFDQRPDGRLDFTFHGTTFIPLGDSLAGSPVRWALPLTTGDRRFASIPASGLALHPHLHLSTREPAASAGESDSAEVPEIPENAVREYTLYTRNSSFGDLFTLDVPELGGNAKGRSQLLGRAHLQFGPRFGNAVPVAISLLPAGGLLRPAVETPVTRAFPGRLPAGPLGHDEFLRFPLRTFYLDGVGFNSDPFDLAVGAVDLGSGRFIHPLLHRGLISQNLFFALVRVEPRTPQSSFFFAGPARFDANPDGRAVLRHLAAVRIPYPEGFAFPAPDLTTRVTVGPGSRLDPYLWVQAVDDGAVEEARIEGGAENVTASTGQRFSYRYAISGDPSRPSTFEYTNQFLGGTFLLLTLSWVGFLNSLGGGAERGRYDTVTFAGLGTWSLDASGQMHTATVQISRPPRTPYVSIQIDGGLVSNVNTKPDEVDALP